MQGKGYNGWSNYETWAVGMFLDGNYDGEGTYLEVLELVRESAQDSSASTIWTEEQAALFSVEDALTDWARERIEGDLEGIAADLLRSALDAVDWTELAEHKLAEVREDQS